MSRGVIVIGDAGVHPKGGICVVAHPTQDLCDQRHGVEGRSLSAASHQVLMRMLRVASG